MRERSIRMKMLQLSGAQLPKWLRAWIENPYTMREGFDSRRHLGVLIRVWRGPETLRHIASLPAGELYAMLSQTEKSLLYKW